MNRIYDAKTKKIPSNIAEIRPLGRLAYWIMDDGSFTGSGLRISTNSLRPEGPGSIKKCIRKQFLYKSFKEETSGFKINLNTPYVSQKPNYL
jgi:hypothetical protein